MEPIVHIFYVLKKSTLLPYNTLEYITTIDHSRYNFFYGRVKNFSTVNYSREHYTSKLWKSNIMFCTTVEFNYIHY